MLEIWSDERALTHVLHKYVHRTTHTVLYLSQYGTWVCRLYQPGLSGSRCVGVSEDRRGPARGGRGGPLLSDDPMLRGGGAKERDTQ